MSVKLRVRDVDEERRQKSVFKDCVINKSSVEGVEGCLEVDGSLRTFGNVGGKCRLGWSFDDIESSAQDQGRGSMLNIRSWFSSVKSRSV